MALSRTKKQIQCVECGTVGVRGESHYPGRDPENGPRHYVVSVSDFKKECLKRIQKADSPERQANLAADIMVAGWGRFPDKDVKELLQLLADRWQLPLNHIKALGEEIVYGV